MTNEANETFFGLIAKYAIALGLILTVVSFLVKFFLFAGWGINYSVVATPSDLAIGGVEAFSSMQIWFVMAFVIAPIAWRTKIPFRHQRKIHFLFVLVAIIYAIFASAFDTMPVIRDEEIDFKSNYGIYLLISAVLLYLSLLSLFHNMGFLSWYFFTFIFIGFMTHSVAASSINRSSRLIAVNLSNCDQTEFVVWAGTDYIISSCSAPPYDANIEYFISPREGVKLIKMSARKGTHNAQTH